MSRKKVSLALLLIALALGALWYGRSRRPPGQDPRSDSSEAGPLRPAAETAHGAGQPRPGSSAHPVAGPPQQAAWQRLREMVGRARQRREEQGRSARLGAGQASTEGASPGEPAGSLDKDTIKEAIRAIVPLVKECYEQALGRAGGAKGAGRLVVEFKIEGEPEVGGVVSESSINAEKSTLAEPLLQECVQESMYALQLPPPSHGGVVKVSYPFVFSSGEPAGALPPGQSR